MGKEKKNVPEIRFPGFSGPWEQRKVGDFLTESKVPGHTGADAKKLTVKLWGKGVVEKTDKIGGSENTQYYVRSAGQFMYGKLDFLHAAFGIVPQKLDKYESTLDSPAFDLHGIDGQFLLNRVLQQDFYLRNGMVANGSRKAKRIHEDTFLNMDLLVPSYAEQQEIGTFFSNLDNLITLHQREYDLLNELKKGCLQKMFPKKDENIPEIRFPGFTGPWEQRKLGDFGSVAMCKRIFKDQTEESGDVPFYKIGTFGGEPDAYISRELFEKYKQLYSYPEKGDILISASGSIGRTVEYTGEDAYYQDSNIVWLKHDKTIVNSFLKHLYEVIQWAGIEGSTIKRLYNDNILKTEVMMPSVPEQEEIGKYFDSIDNLITLHQRDIDLLKKFKKGMLQKMFV